MGMDDREDIILGLYCAIVALRALNSKFPKTGQLVEPAIQACSGAVNLLKEQEHLPGAPDTGTKAASSPHCRPRKAHRADPQVLLPIVQ